MILIKFVPLTRYVFKKYTYFSMKHKNVFAVELTLLHVSALFTGHDQAIEHIEA